MTNVAHVRVLAAVVKQGDRYLICQRPLDKRHGGLWEFLGGKLEPNESLEDAANRELREELGVNAVLVGQTLMSIMDPGSPFVIEFTRTDISGEPACLEHAAIRWATLEGLLELPLAPSDRCFAEFLSDQSTSDVV